MISQFVYGRVHVFIDAANILYSQQTLGWRIDYEKLKKYLSAECDLKGINYYMGKMENDSQQFKFIIKLRNLGYRMIVKEVKRIKIAPGKYQFKGNLDVELVIDALKYSDAYDTFILMSGDSDFAPLLDELRSKNKLVLVMSTKHHIARELIERAKYVNLKNLKEQISRRK